MSMMSTMYLIQMHDERVAQLRAEAQQERLARLARLAQQDDPSLVRARAGHPERTRWLRGSRLRWWRRPPPEDNGVACSRM